MYNCTSLLSSIHLKLYGFTNSNLVTFNNTHKCIAKKTATTKKKRSTKSGLCCKTT